MLIKVIYNAYLLPGMLLNLIQTLELPCEELWECRIESKDIVWFIHWYILRIAHHSKLSLSRYSLNEWVDKWHLSSTMFKLKLK